MLQRDRELLNEVLAVDFSVIDMFHNRLANQISGSSFDTLLYTLKGLCLVNKPNKNGTYYINLELTQKSFAQMLNMHYTTCNRLMKILEKEDIAILEQGTLKIHSLERIEHFLEEGYKPNY